MRRALTLLAAALLTPHAARAFDDSGVALGGYVKGFYFQQAVDPFDLDRAGTRLQLSARGGDMEPASYYAAVDFELNTALFEGGDSLARGEGFDVYPVEIYANLSLGPTELRVGKQFVFWGRTAWVNPTDVITAWDYANIASEIEDYRVAPLAARLNWYIFDELMLDLVWAPVFQPHRIPMHAPAEMGGLPVIETEPALPDPHPTNGEYGLRLSQSISTWALDWAIAAYLGFDKAPGVDVAPVLTPLQAGPPGSPPVLVPTSLRWTKRYQRLLMVGADFAKAIGAFVIKGEGAIKAHPPLEPSAASRRHTQAEGVLGVDYLWSEELDLGLQYVTTYRLDYDREAIADDLEQRMGQVPPFVEAAWEHALTLRANAKLGDAWSGQLIGLYSATYQDFMLLAFVGWDMADALKLYVGGLAFGGADADTPMGRQQDFSRLFVELKYSF